MLSALPSVLPGTVLATGSTLQFPEAVLQLPMDVDPVLVGIIAVLLLVIFLLFLLVRRTVKSFTEGMREGRR